MRIIGSPVQGAVESAGSTHAPRTLSEGDVLRGEVVAAKGDQVQIKSPSGAILKATVLADVGIAEGDRLTLQVVSKTQDQIVMRVLAEAPGSGGTDMASRLAAANLEMTPANTQIYEHFSRMGVPMNPEWLRAAASLMEANPQLTVREAVFLALNALEGTPRELSELLLLQDGTKLGALLDDLQEQLAQAARGGAEADGRAAQADALPKGSLIPLSVGADPGSLLAPGQAAAPGSADAAGHALAFARPSDEAVAAFTRYLALRHPAAADALPKELVPGALTVARAAALMPEGEAEPLIRAFAESLRQAGASSGGEALAEALRGLAAELRMPDALAANAPMEAARQALRFLEGMYARAERGDAPVSQALREAAEGLRPGLEAVRRSLVAAGAENSGAVQQAGQALEQVRFTDSFQRFVYMQIPVQLNEFKSTAELYVMKRNDRRKKIDPENATLLVALDTERIGRVESMIRVEGRTVAIHFRLQNERLCDGFFEHVPELQAMLAESRFRLVDIRCQLLTEPITPVTAEEEWLGAFGRPPARVEVMA